MVNYQRLAASETQIRVFDGFSRIQDTLVFFHLPNRSISWIANQDTTKPF